MVNCKSVELRLCNCIECIGLLLLWLLFHVSYSQ
jgi:hypothetical protein